MINYDGPRVLFAIKQHPRQALADIKHMIAGIAALTAERAALQQRVAACDEHIRDLQHEIVMLKAKQP